MPLSIKYNIFLYSFLNTTKKKKKTTTVNLYEKYNNYNNLRKLSIVQIGCLIRIATSSKVVLNYTEKLLFLSYRDDIGKSICSNFWSMDLCPCCPSLYLGVVLSINCFCIFVLHLRKGLLLTAEYISNI